LVDGNEAWDFLSAVKLITSVDSQSSIGPSKPHEQLYAAIQASTLTLARKQWASGPSANAVRYHLEDQVLGDIAVLEDEWNELLAGDWPPGLRGGRAKVAIDLVDVPYPGQPLAEEAELCRRPAQDGTMWFHR